MDTYVYDLTDTPTYNNYGSFLYNNVEDLKAEFTKSDIDNHVRMVLQTMQKRLQHRQTACM